jgi:hypothetical protein
MAFKVNYNQQRAERDRAKQAKKEAKQREKDEEIARRKAEREAPGYVDPDAAAQDATAHAVKED